MKKKKNYRFLAILFSFMFLFFVGCDGGPGGLLGDDVPKSLDGVKVITRPGDYDFDNAVGDAASKYYYNLFATNVMLNLSGMYQQGGKVKDASLFKNFDINNGLTYSYNEDDRVAKFGNLDTDIYYVLDSMRYNLTSIQTNTDASGIVTSQILTFDTSSAWLWSLDKNATGYENIFNQLATKQSDVVSITEQSGQFIVSFNLENVSYESWLKAVVEYGHGSYFIIPNYQKFYAFVDTNGEFNNKDIDSKDERGQSPYYEQLYGDAQEGNPSLNYFQDAMEYATYLFVLGYDYIDEQGNPTEDAPYFDFELEKTNGAITNIYVTFNGERAGIVEALGKIKTIYKDNANIVGITAKNKEQIKRFIIDKIIGRTAYENFNTYTITNGNNPIKINKNYDVFLDNLLTYACKEAPIGKISKDAEESLSLSDAYLASQITDYKGDYFFLSYEDNNDDDMFKYIDAAEYQSLILYPRQEQIGETFGDLWLAFEYYEAPEGTEHLPFADSITFNIGLRYFDCTANNGAGGYTYVGEVQKTIEYGSINDKESEDENWVLIGFTELDGVYDLVVDTPIVFNTPFNNDIGGGVLNGLKNAGEGEEVGVIPITGVTDARKYLKLNNSTTYGSYGTLNPDMFSQNVAGSEACDYFEVYFDVVKEKGVSRNYNFKVGIKLFEMEQEH